MKSMVDRFVSYVRLGVLGGTLGVAVLVLAIPGSSEDKKAAKNPPPKFKVDDAPVQRSGHVTASFAPVVKKVAPSVVNIFTTTRPKRAPEQMMPFLDDPFFRRFFGDSFDGRDPRREFRAPKQHGLGSGVIVTEDGYILTNNHVVEGADEIKVALNSGKQQYTAQVVGRDPKSDLAVLRIEAEKLTAAPLGNSDEMEVGDVVLAIGNPFGIGQTVTMGIVSATGRATLGLDYEDFIQTDAAINPGNSGGALVDASGRLVGINTAILSRSGGNQGIGFAVPISLARSVMESLIRDGRVVRGYLGVNIQDVSPGLAKQFNLPEAKGALVAEVMPDTPASQAGLENGDVVLEFDGKDIRDSRHLKLLVAQTAPGKQAALKVLRDGKEKSIEVTLKELPRSVGGSEEPELSENAASDGLDGVTVGDLDSRTRSRLDLPAELEGAVVTEVDPESAAYEAGLRQGDVIREINRKPVRNAAEAVKLTRGLKGKTILLRVWSQGGTRFVVVEDR